MSLVLSSPFLFCHPPLPPARSLSGSLSLSLSFTPFISHPPLSLLSPLSLPSSGGSGNPTVGVRGVWGGSAHQNANANPPSNNPPPPSHQDSGHPPSGNPYGGGGGGGGGDEGGGGGARRGGREGFVGRTGGGDADGGYEGKLIEEICAAGGTKSTPGKVCFFFLSFFAFFCS